MKKRLQGENEKKLIFFGHFLTGCEEFLLNLKHKIKEAIFIASFIKININVKQRVADYSTIHLMLYLPDLKLSMTHYQTLYLHHLGQD